MIKISENILNTEQIVASVESPDCGGINVFIGNVRDNTKGRKVLYLEFEAYERMALSELEKICNDAKRKFEIKDISIHHRSGKVEIGEAAVVIAVSSPHRDASFKACRFAIDTLKETVPIWKREVYEDGHVWVSAHP